MYHSKAKLGELLIASADRVCHDTRDKVYALLGMVPSDAPYSPVHASPPSINWNYLINGSELECLEASSFPHDDGLWLEVGPVGMVFQTSVIPGTTPDITDELVVIWEEASLAQLSRGPLSWHDRISRDSIHPDYKPVQHSSPLLLQWHASVEVGDKVFLCDTFRESMLFREVPHEELALASGQEQACVQCDLSEGGSSKMEQCQRLFYFIDWARMDGLGTWFNEGKELENEVSGRSFETWLVDRKPRETPAGTGLEYDTYLMLESRQPSNTLVGQGNGDRRLSRHMEGFIFLAMLCDGKQMIRTSQVHLLRRVLRRQQVSPRSDGLGASVDQRFFDPATKDALSRAKAGKLEGV
ncbi:hypothetical protein Micbo1qcDRAFT_172566 [Microdochium bolleyi]|uniref:Uncharacterized protein n=1 Tax=Microdochium bolleyi TaxID=196109 RepID=A0A136J905_9PEZI|nr:hypothetical protein Micbo1qcDRAFT_172566 [Microdochium bolleyi]